MLHLECAKCFVLFFLFRLAATSNSTCRYCQQSLDLTGHCMLLVVVLQDSLDVALIIRFIIVVVEVTVLRRRIIEICVVGWPSSHSTQYHSHIPPVLVICWFA